MIVALHWLHGTIYREDHSPVHTRSGAPIINLTVPAAECFASMDYCTSSMCVGRPDLKCTIAIYVSLILTVVMLSIVIDSGGSRWAADGYSRCERGPSFPGASVGTLG